MISTALGPLHRLTKEDSSNSKIFAEHVSAYVSYVISFGHGCLNFYEEMNKVTHLSHFLECFISCATMCLQYGKLSVVRQCLEAVRQFMNANTDIAINIDISSLLHFFCGQALAEQSNFIHGIEYFKEALEYGAAVLTETVRRSPSVCASWGERTTIYLRARKLGRIIMKHLPSFVNILGKNIKM